jgi:DNA-binding NtrC family response regulator
VSDTSSILVVEDDAALRMVCRVNLELDRFRVREAAGLAEARAAVADERPALVFLDLHLGQGAADDFLDELTADGIPVVLVSGTVDVTAYEGRATAVMPKPFDPADLVAAAHRHAVG